MSSIIVLAMIIRLDIATILFIIVLQYYWFNIYNMLYMLFVKFYYCR